MRTETAMRGMLAVAALGLAAVNLDAGRAPQSDPVTIRVDTAVKKGPMHPFWAWFGHDEPNYTYTANGKKLLSALQELSPVPVFVRVHNLLTSGDGKYALKWGSTNVYTEDARGNPIYDWKILDQIVDTYVARKMKPFVQLGFMPEALSSAPAGVPYRHFWKPGDPYNDIYTGWTYAPKDYKKWEELCYQVTRHLVEKYGRREVESWWFELWNEPDIGYWSGSVGPGRGRGDPLAAEKAQTRRDEFNKLYDFTVEGVRRALPTARIGGPEVTGGAQNMLRSFLQHTSSGTNYATGKIGTPLDVITFHAKGSPTFVENRVRMGVASQLRNINNHFAVIKEFPMYAKTPTRDRRIRSRRLRGLRSDPLPAERLPERDDVPDLYGAADRAHLRAGRSAPGEPARRGDLGIPVRGSAVLRRLPRSRDQRHRQAGAQHVPHARPDDRRPRGGGQLGGPHGRGDSRQRRARCARHLGAGSAVVTIGHGPDLELPR